MNENEFEFNGKTYVAVEDELPCKNCAFWGKSCGILQWHGKIPPCSAPYRKDDKDVRFVMKETYEREEAARYSLQCRKESLDELILRTERAKLKGESCGATAEIEETKLALQDAKKALARTREDRDKLRREVAELWTKIERLRNDVAYWRGEAEAQERLIDVLAKDNELLTAKGKAKR